MTEPMQGRRSFWAAAVSSTTSKPRRTRATPIFFRDLRRVLSPLPPSAFWRESHGPWPFERDAPPFRGVRPRGAWPPPRDVVRRGNDVRKLFCDAQKPS